MRGSQKKRCQLRNASSTGGLHLLARRQVSALPLTAERQANVLISYYTSIDALVGGYADASHVDTIVYALNISRLLAMRHLGEEYIEQISEAQLAIIRCQERYQTAGKYGLDGPGLVAIKAISVLHEAQIEMASQAELQAAIVEMHRLLGLEAVRA